MTATPVDKNGDGEITVDEIDANDRNQDGTVTQDELDAVANEMKPKSILESLRDMAPILANPLGYGMILPTIYTSFMENRQYDQKVEALQAQYPQAAQSAQSAADQALEESAKVPDLPSGKKEKSGYLGVDDMLEAKAAAKEMGNDGVVRYYVDTKDGAREVLYKEGDPYKTLVNMGTKERAAWRKTMWLGGYLEADSFVGPPTMKDVEALQNAMTEANFMGQTWQDAIASRVEQGARYGRPITEAEIMELDDDVPGLLRKYAKDNGITVSDEFIARQQRRVLNGKDTPESVVDRLRDHYVKPLYPQFEKELNDGLTMSDIASPYMDRASAMLELPSNQLSLQDPLIRKALDTRDQSGQPIRKPMWEFEDELTKDPRWRYTDNAYDAYDSAVNGMVSEMGL